MSDLESPMKRYGAAQWAAAGAATGLMLTGALLPDPQKPNWISRGPTTIAGKIFPEDTWRDYSDTMAFGALPALAAGYAITRDVQSGNYDRTLGLVITNAATFGSINVTKKLVARERPGYTADMDDKYESFPSGHTGLSMANAAYTATDVLYSFGDDNPAAAGIVAGTLVLSGMTVGVARSGGNRHYWEDTLVGGGIGAGIAIGTHALFVQKETPIAQAGDSKDMGPALGIMAGSAVLGAGAEILFSELKDRKDTGPSLAFAPFSDGEHSGLMIMGSFK